MNAELALKLVETTRFCINCKWCDDSLTRPYECRAPQNFRSELSLVTGATDITPIIQFCSVQRTTTVADRCGREGKWFEPRTGEGEA